MKNTNVKNKSNKIEIIKNAETLAAVHTHTHTGACHLVNKSNVRYAGKQKLNRGLNKHKDRTMLKIGNIGLSLCFLESLPKCAKGDGLFLQFFAIMDRLDKGEEYFSQKTMSRDGPITIRYKSRLII